MSGIVVAPIVVMWFVVKIFLPDEMYDLGITVSMVGWLVWCVMLWAWAKSDAGNFLVFPQSKWRFPDGTCRTFDLKIPPDSWDKLCEFKDGATGYRILFAEKFEVADPDVPFPIVFDSAYWLLPSEFDKTFKRRAVGEFFHKGVFVTKPDCEDVSLFVTGWEERDGKMTPVCIVNDCSFNYQRALLENSVPMMRGNNPIYLLYRAERQRSEKLLQHSAYLEDLNKVAYEDEPRDFKKSADDRMKQIRERHGSIMDTQQSLLTRILNLKTLAIVLIVFAVVFVVGRVFLGIW
jgi:hypothetical protein